MILKRETRKQEIGERKNLGEKLPGNKKKKMPRVRGNMQKGSDRLAITSAGKNINIESGRGNSSWLWSSALERPNRLSFARILI